MANIGLHKVIADSLNSVIGLADQKDITLIYGKPTELVVWADGERITQVLINLLSNAIKFTPEGKKIEVVVRDRGEQAEVCVIEHGPRFLSVFTRCRSPMARATGARALVLPSARA